MTYGIPLNISSAQLVRRLVGTLQDLPGRNLISNGTKNTYNYRVRRYTKYPVIDPSVIYVGFAKNASGEINTANAVTYHTALELQSGTIIEFTKNGSASHVVNPGDITNESDRLTGVTIPAGYFWLRGHAAVTITTQFYWQTDISSTSSSVTSSAVEEGIDLTDKTLSGAITPVTQRQVYTPCVMGSVPALRRSFGIVGDSIGQGTGGGVLALGGDGYGGDIGPLAGYLADKYDYIHLGAASANFANDSTLYAKRDAFALAVGLTDGWSNRAINDLSSGNRSAAITAGFATTCFANHRTNGRYQRLYQSTCTPDVTIVGPPASDSNQTNQANLTDDRRQDWDANYVRTLSVVGIDGYVEQALAVENAIDNNWWIANYTSDGRHPSPTGCTAMINYASGGPF